MTVYKTKVVAVRFTAEEHQAMSRFIGKVVGLDKNGTITPKNIGEVVRHFMATELDHALVYNKKCIKAEEAKAKRQAKKEAANGL